MGKFKKPSKHSPTMVKGTCKECLCDFLLKIHWLPDNQNKVEVKNISFSDKAKLMLLERERETKARMSKRKSLGDRMGGA